MSSMKCSEFLVMFLWKLAVSRGDSEVSCVFMETCILPCRFQVGPQFVIHWFHLQRLGVHSYYDNQDQLGHQEERFRNRTSLFKDQISRGNASLQLTGVKVQDEGRYECFISTIERNKESFINLKVYAPVHKVNIQQVENRITCSSEGIYPEPELTWSTRPPSTMSLQNTSTVQQNEQQLYCISSSLVLSDNDTDLVYSCTVSTPTNRRRAAWRKLTPVSGSTPETIITCAASDFSFSDLVWRFNHRQIIVKQSRTDGSSTVSEEWRQQVKDVSESGDITLQDLSSDQEGIYTCEVSNAEETLISDTYVEISGGKTAKVTLIIWNMCLSCKHQRSLNSIMKLPGTEHELTVSISGSSVSAGGIIGGVVGAVLVLTTAVGLFLFWKKKRGQQENSMRRSNIDETTSV